jgi:hypothetical protein
MTPGAILTFVPFLFGLFAAQPTIVGQTVTRLIEEDQIVLRVPVEPHPSVRIDWHEKKGPKCIPMRAIAHAMLSGPQQVDFILVNRQHVRAELDNDCPALDFYGGFYLQLPDDRLCAGRDAIRPRMGGSCTIEKFKMLVPKLHREH